MIVEEIEHKIIEMDTLICYGDSIYLDYNGMPWYLPGEYQTTLKAEGGCDSITIKCNLRRMPEMKFNVSEKDGFDLLGNTVVVPVIKAVAERLLDALKI